MVCIDRVPFIWFGHMQIESLIFDRQDLGRVAVYACDSEGSGNVLLPGEFCQLGADVEWFRAVGRAFWL
jgi:hypothetical protein